MTSKNDSINELAVWIAKHWENGFSHKYSIADSASPVWRKWRQEIQPSSYDLWWCESLGQAAKHYSWTMTEPSFEELSRDLLSALTTKNETSCLSICQKIFKWGGVARKKSDHSNQWVIQAAKTSKLCSSILRAVDLLTPTCTESLEEFDGINLIMNSALTKVYAAADPTNKTVIYDGRVGAALGLLVRKMLEERSVNNVPEDLMFDWGPPSSRKAAKLRTRDPSFGTWKFNQIPNTSQNAQADKRRANLSRITNRLLSNATGLLNSAGKNVAPIELERALFMIGYDVRTNGK